MIKRKKKTNNRKSEDETVEIYSKAILEVFFQKIIIKDEDAVERNTETRSLSLNELHGDHETQESEGGEADLRKHFKVCKKNPGHLNFIPVDTFSLEHLPENYPDNYLYECIKVAADLTVRVDVKMTSPHRPEYWPGTKAPYPFYNLRGKSTLKTGTGTARWVKNFTDGRDDVNGDKHWNGCVKCWCTKCKHSDHPSSVWWEFDVLTARHVVFDDTEANHTSLSLFYDRVDRTVDIYNKVSDCKILGVNNIEKFINMDRCYLTCVTCDENIGDKLCRSWEHFYDVWMIVNNKYESSRNKHRMTIIVSHPHGCPKQVSVGQWKDMYKLGACYKKYTYTTSTCPGSSGAPVFCVGFLDGWLYKDLVHSGSHMSGLNYSCIGSVFS